MIPRLLCAIILATVPLAKGLNSTQLLSIPTGLILFILLWETIGSLKRDFDIAESWKEDAWPEITAAAEMKPETNAALDETPR